MKNVLLLGNGFDLHHGLPTKYHNFLNVVSFLQNSDITNIKTIGSVFSNFELQNEDKFIKNCYEKNHDVFDNVEINHNELTEIIALTKNNKWFLYLNQVFNKDIGWIDFEKEISYVLDCFSLLFNDSRYFRLQDGERDKKYVIDFFGDFMEGNNPSYASQIYCINSNFCIEKPLNSGKFVVDKDKIIKFLYNELMELKEALKLYLKCFVEDALPLIKSQPKNSNIRLLAHMHSAVTFNYTSTYEVLYYKSNVHHIHGRVNDDIVLGVNPDEKDFIEHVDTTFVRFKKYFQRTNLNTDFDYLRWIHQNSYLNEYYRLFVLGHSLDVTDKDILEEVFDRAVKIYIFFHSIDVKQDYIENLVLLFGKKKFDELRKDKKLTFLYLEQDFTELENEIIEESWDDAIGTLVF